MKRVTLAAVLVAAMSPIASADGLPGQYRPAYGLYDWTGLYIGAHIGWERGDIVGTFDDFQSGINFGPSSFYNQSIRGWLGGGQVGVNHQIGRAVLGVEFSGSWAKVDGSSTGTLGPQSFGPVACLNPDFNTGIGTRTITCNAKENWSAQMLAKAGYALGDGRFLPYLTGGIALAELTTSNSSTNIIGGQTIVIDLGGASKVIPGAVLGGGLQYAIGHGISIGTEYLYTRYASQDFSSTGPKGPISPDPASHDLTTQTLRFVVNYKFGERDAGPLK